MTEVLMKKNRNKKITNKIRSTIADEYEDIPLLFMDPSTDFDNAIVGICSGFGLEPKVAYDYDKVIKANMKNGMSYEEAEEYFDYNQIGAYVGEHTPVFIRKIQK